MTDRIIIIEQQDGRFAVRVDPPFEGDDFARTDAEYKAVRGWAGGLRLTHRWPIEDRTLSDGEARA